MEGIQNKLLIGAIIVIHSEKEVSVVKITGNKKNIQKPPKVALLDSMEFPGVSCSCDQRNMWNEKQSGISKGS